MSSPKGVSADASPAAAGSGTATATAGGGSADVPSVMQAGRFKIKLPPKRPSDNGDGSKAVQPGAAPRPQHGAPHTDTVVLQPQHHHQLQHAGDVDASHVDPQSPPGVNHAQGELPPQSLSQAHMPEASAPTGSTPVSQQLQQQQQTHAEHKKQATSSTHRQATSGAGAAADPEGAASALMTKLREFVEDSGGTLPPGWRVEIKVRSAGSTAGTTDAYYFDPAGKRYRSRAEIAKHLGLEVPERARKSSGAAASGSSKPPGSSGKAAAKSEAAAEDVAAQGFATATSPSATASMLPPATLASPAMSPAGSMQAVASVSREAAVAVAQQRAADMAVELPLTLKNAVVVEALGAIDIRPGFSSATNLWPVGYRSYKEDPAVGKFVQEVRDNNGFPQFTITLLPNASSRRSSLQDNEEAAAGSSNGSSSRWVQLAAARTPDAAWQQVVELQSKALLQQQGQATANATAAANGVPGSSSKQRTSKKAATAAQALADPEACALLCKSMSFKGCKGRDLFGFGDTVVLQLIEGLPGAESCSKYHFADERGAGDHAADGGVGGSSGGKATKRKSGGGGQQPARILQSGKLLSPAGTPKQQQPAALSSSKRKRSAALEALAAAFGGLRGGQTTLTVAANATPRDAATPASPAKRHKPSPVAAPASATATKAVAPLAAVPARVAPKPRHRAPRGMSVEERQIYDGVHQVMDKMMRKLETWEAGEAAKAAKAAGKAAAAVARKQAQEQRKQVTM